MSHILSYFHWKEIGVKEDDKMGQMIYYVTSFLSYKRFNTS